MLVLLLVVVGLFWKTIFTGAAISKVHQIAEWDSVFSKYSTGQSQLMDPSQILLMVPYYLLIGRMWSYGEVPLWNSLSGFGGPLLADPQALAFSIFHLPLSFGPTVGTYNIVLVFELFVLAIGSYILGRTIELSRIPSTFMALTLLLCPYEQWYLELLGNGYCLIPLLLAAFFNTAKKRTIGSAVWAGVAAATVVLSAHPELSFCSILLASFLMLMMIPLALWKRGLVLLIVAGCIAFFLSSPMLLPFVEFVLNSDSYKFGNRAPAYYPWQTLLFNLIQPGYGAASPFLGVLATLTLPFGIATIFDGLRKRVVQHSNGWATRSAVVIGVLSIVSWILSAKIFPLGILLARKPFSYLVVTYLFPGLIVLISILAAIGLERILQLLTRPNSASDPEKVADADVANEKWNVAKPLLPLAVGLSAIVLFPLLVQVFHVNLSVANFDMTLPSMVLSKRDWIRDGVVAVVIVLILGTPHFIKKRFLSPRSLSVSLCACLALGAFSQLAISLKSMPVRPDFSYPETDSMALLTILSDRRAVATGAHTMRPNTNLAYGFRDVRFHNPIFPARYLAFLERAGAKLDEFNQVFDDEPSNMIDLASVSLIVTPGALIERKAFDSAVESALSTAVEWSPTLTLTALRYAVDPVSRACYIEPTWKSDSAGKFSFNVSLVNGDGSESWISDRQSIGSPESHSIIGAPIRKSIKGGDELGIKLSVFDTTTGAAIAPPSTMPQLFGKFKSPPLSKNEAAPNRRFKLLQEGESGIRIYENQTALPEAYFATNSLFVNSAEAALARISASDFDGRNCVVLEGAGQDVALAKGSYREPEARILRRDFTNVLIKTTSSKPGYLVFTDSFYPGWIATVDGAAAKILRANYSFRGVAVPLGMHNVEFHYRPIPFYIGLALAAIAAQFVVIIMTIGLMKTLKASSKSD